MTTVLSLNEDVLYVIRSKCSSSIDMWHLLLALNYDLPTIMNLRAFWIRIRLSSLHNKAILYSFIKQISMYCVDLRLDNLNWMVVVDIRHLLSHFRLLVSFHTGNVALSKSTLINDVKNFFPFVKYLTLLISVDDSMESCLTTRQSTNTDETFHSICTTLNEMQHLEHIVLVLQDKKGGCLSDLSARTNFRLACEFISRRINNCTLISIEENGHDIKDRFPSNDSSDRTYTGSIDLFLNNTIKHLIISFRWMLSGNLKLAITDSSQEKWQLESLVLPCVPLTWETIELNQLKLLDIGYVNSKNRDELTRLDELLICHHRSHSLQDLTLNLNEWQSVRFVIRWKNQEKNSAAAQFTSIFENCFDPINTSEDENMISEDHSVKSNDVIDDFLLEFIDDTEATIFQLPLDYSWLIKLTNLNLTGIHYHSIDLNHIFNSLSLLRTLSLSPCLLFYLDQYECHCQSTSDPYEIHSLNRNLLSLNLVCHLTNLKEPCSIFFNQHKHHSIRHSSIHQHLKTNESSFHYEVFIRRIIRTVLQALDLHHFSMRMPNYEMNIDDLNLQENNHLETLIFDVKLPLAFHSKLARFYSINRPNNLKRLVFLSENEFQLTPILIDRFHSLEIIEILSLNCHLNRTTIQYLEKVLKPSQYPNLNTFRLWISSVDATHLLKHLHKTVRLAFEPVKPGFIFDISIVNPSTRAFQTRKCILYDRTHEIHQLFYCVPSHQLSIVYPSYLNSKPLYSERIFPK
ncbi:unnamed protein product [Adineta ricciae]|uniref:Uncharacterized protein n=1 Tax=Adineta ricciae TaxID=249248 RepID=A0A814Y0A8_ADIRI|nr:unnamed protein product [Adineta ricciae]CAF1222890.1 unnamed protein product [Adineta ricciae]